MISTDFAPNETWADAWLSLKLLFQPWKWKVGSELTDAKAQILKLYNDTGYKLHVSFFLTGRSALYNLLKSFNLPKGSEIVIQAFTCEAVVLPILANNLKPAYIDIEPETYSMDVSQMADKLTAKSKVVILQHTFGLTPKHRKEILELAKSKNVIVIEDLAHGFDPQILKSNSLKSKVYYLLSFGRSKSLSSVFGGGILSSNSQLTNQLNNLPYPSYWFIFKCLLYKPLAMMIKSTYDLYLGILVHAAFRKLGLLIPELTNVEKKGNYDKLLDKKYPNALAVLLISQFKKFEQINKKRAKSMSIYNSSFKLKMVGRSGPNKSPLIRYPLIVHNRIQLLAKLMINNIFLGKWYDQVVAPEELDLKRVGYKVGSCPIAEKICQKIVNLPTNISEPEAKKLVKMFTQSE